MNNRVLKLTSLITVFCFLVTQSGFAAPALQIQSDRETPVALSFHVPAELATLESLSQAPESSRMILQIRNAHSNYDAQIKIRELLKYLRTAYGIRTVFIEGAAEKLNPDFLKFFPDSKRNAQLAEWLTKQGILDGAGLFIADEVSGVEGLPLEDVTLYRKNFEALKAVFSHQAEIDSALSKLETRISKDASKIFSPNLQKAIAEWERFQKGQREFLPYLNQLAHEAHQVLQLDLRNVFSQADWPQLVRVLALQNTEKKIDSKKLLEEKSRLVSFLKSKKVSEKLITQISLLDSRTEFPASVSYRNLLENLITEARPLGFRLKDWPAFCDLMTFLTLKQELDAQALNLEIEKLFSRMMDKLAQTQEEKELVSFIRDFSLFKKLMHLELSREEWIKFQERKQELVMARFMKRIETKKGTGRGVLPVPFFSQELYQKALEFYSLAMQRDQMFYTMIDRQMKERGITKAAVVTGGFHSEGLGNILRKNKTSFAVLTPHLSEITGDKLYRDVMLGSQTHAFKVSYLAQTEPAQSLATLRAMTGATPSFIVNAVNGMAVVSGLPGLVPAFNASPAARLSGQQLLPVSPTAFKLTPANRAELRFVDPMVLMQKYAANFSLFAADHLEIAAQLALLSLQLDRETIRDIGQLNALTLDVAHPQTSWGFQAAAKLQEHAFKMLLPEALANRFKEGQFLPVSVSGPHEVSEGEPGRGYFQWTVVYHHPSFGKQGYPVALPSVGVGILDASMMPAAVNLQIWNLAAALLDLESSLPKTDQAVARDDIGGRAELRREYFPGINKVDFEGRHSIKPLSFKWYDPERVIGGAKMKDILKVTVAYWHTLKGRGGDIFGPGTMVRPWDEGPSKTNEEKMVIAKQTMDAAFEFFVKIGATHWTFHDRDISPEAVFEDGPRKGEIDVVTTRENLEEMVRYAKVKQDETGVKLLWGTANVFSNPRFKDGAGSNPNFDVVAHAAAQIRAAMRATMELGGENYVFWGGREGYATLLNTDTRLEKQHMATLMQLAVKYNEELSREFKRPKLQLLIEPKPHEPTQSQYDFDAGTTLGFLRQHGLEKEFKLNIEANHATLAKHSFQHELQVAQDAGALGSIDINQGDLLTGWDTDHFAGFVTAVEAMLVVLKQGGLGRGGFNYDAKARRESTDLVDLFHAHIGGIDALAKALIVAYKIYTETDYLKRKKQQYASFASGNGKRFEDGELTLQDLEDHAFTVGEPQKRSGREEALTALVEHYMSLVADDMPLKTTSLEEIVRLANEPPQPDAEADARPVAIRTDKAVADQRANVTHEVRDYFPDVPKVAYEGPESANPLAFTQYDPERVIGGKKMKDFFRMTVAYWHTLKGRGSDPFGPGTQKRPWDEGDDTTNEGRMKIAKQTMDAAFEFFVKIGATHWTFHDRDIAPEAYFEDGTIDAVQTLANFEEMVRYAKQKQDETGIKLLWGTANVFSNPRFMRGAGSNPNFDVVAHAGAQIRAAMEATKILGGENYVFWGGREGYATLHNTEMRLEKQHIAILMKMAVKYNQELTTKYGGEDLQLLIEPKPHEPTQQQYDFDTGNVLNFLREHGLDKHFKLNIEANHATLAKHSFEHELQMAQDAGMLGSIDINEGDPNTWWDTDHFANFPTALEAMLVVLKQGGLGKGGFNFDAKLRRGSTDLEDLFHAHIQSMDALARALTVAYRLYTESDFLHQRKARYGSFSSGLGGRFDHGDSTLTLHDLEGHAISAREPRLVSGGEEFLRGLVQRFQFSSTAPRASHTFEDIARFVRSEWRIMVSSGFAGAGNGALHHLQKRSENRGKEGTSRLSGYGKNWTLGINASTQSITFTLVSHDPDTRGVIWKHQELFSSDKYQKFGAPQGHMEVINQRDPQRFVTSPAMVAAALETGMLQLQKFMADHELQMSNIRAIAPGAQQHATVFLGKNAGKVFKLGEPLSEQMNSRLAHLYSPIWRNKSTGRQVEDLTEILRGPSGAVKKTGSVVEQRFPAAGILQVSDEDSAEYQNTASILNMTAFIGYLLTGNARFPWDPGDAVPSNLVDPRRPTQWMEGINILIPGLSAKLPEILPTTQIVGKISPFWKQYGFSAQTQIANGTGDNPANLIGLGMFRPGRTAISLGTSFVLSLGLENRAALEQAVEKSVLGNIMGTAFQNRLMKLFCFQNGALALQNIRDEYISDDEAKTHLESNSVAGKSYTSTELQELPTDQRTKLISAAKWEIFNALVASTPAGNNGAMMITQNTDEGALPIKHRPGNPHVKNLQLKPENRAQILRAAVEGQIYFLRHVAELGGVKVSEINLTGGAAKNPVIRQIVADIFNAKVFVLKKKSGEDVDSVSYGMAINAWKAFKDDQNVKLNKRPMTWPEATKGLVEFEDEPTQPLHHQAYEAHFRDFAELVQDAIRSELRDLNPFSGIGSDKLGELRFLANVLDHGAQVIPSLHGYRIREMFNYWADVLSVPSLDESKTEQSILALQRHVVEQFRPQSVGNSWVHQRIDELEYQEPVKFFRFGNFFPKLNGGIQRQVQYGPPAAFYVYASLDFSRRLVSSSDFRPYVLIKTSNGWDPIPLSQDDIEVVNDYKNGSYRVKITLPWNAIAYKMGVVSPSQRIPHDFTDEIGIRRSEVRSEEKKSGEVPNIISLEESRFTRFLFSLNPRVLSVDAAYIRSLLEEVTDSGLRKFLKAFLKSDPESRSELERELVGSGEGVLKIRAMIRIAKSLGLRTSLEAPLAGPSKINPKILPLVDETWAEAFLREHGVSGLISPAALSEEIIDENLAAGLPLGIEIAFRGGNRERTLELIHYATAKKKSTSSPAIVQAGTVLNYDDAMDAIGAGAETIITPGLTLSKQDVGVIRSLGVDVIMGVGSPDEAREARKRGVSQLKAFPFEGDPIASAKGPMPKELQGELDQVELTDDPKYPPATFTNLLEFAKSKPTKKQKFSYPHLGEILVAEIRKAAGKKFPIVITGGVTPEAIETGLLDKLKAGAALSMKDSAAARRLGWIFKNDRKVLDAVKVLRGAIMSLTSPKGLFASQIDFNQAGDLYLQNAEPDVALALLGPGSPKDVSSFLIERLALPEVQQSIAAENLERLLQSAKINPDIWAKALAVRNMRDRLQENPPSFHEFASTSMVEVNPDTTDLGIEGVEIVRENVLPETSINKVGKNPGQTAFLEQHPSTTQTFRVTHGVMYFPVALKPGDPIKLIRIPAGLGIRIRAGVYHIGVTGSSDAEFMVFNGTVENPALEISRDNHATFFTAIGHMVVAPRAEVRSVTGVDEETHLDEPTLDERLGLQSAWNSSLLNQLGEDYLQGIHPAGSVDLSGVAKSDGDKGPQRSEVRDNLVTRIIAGNLPQVSELSESSLEPEILAAVALAGIFHPDATFEEIQAGINEVRNALMDQGSVVSALNRLEHLGSLQNRNLISALFTPSDVKAGLVLRTKDLPTSAELLQLLFFMTLQTGMRITIVAESGSHESWQTLMKNYVELRDLNGNRLFDRIKFANANRDRLNAVTGEQVSALAQSLSLAPGSIVILNEGEQAGLLDHSVGTVIQSNLGGDTSLVSARNYVALWASLLHVDLNNGAWQVLNRQIPDALSPRVGYFEMNQRALKGMAALLAQIFAREEIQTAA